MESKSSCNEFNVAKPIRIQTNQGNLRVGSVEKTSKFSGVSKSQEDLSRGSDVPIRVELAVDNSFTNMSKSVENLASPMTNLVSTNLFRAPSTFSLYSPTGFTLSGSHSFSSLESRRDTVSRDKGVIERFVSNFIMKVVELQGGFRDGMVIEAIESASADMDLDLKDFIRIYNSKKEKIQDYLDKKYRKKFVVGVNKKAIQREIASLVEKINISDKLSDQFEAEVKSCVTTGIPINKRCIETILEEIRSRIEMDMVEKWENREGRTSPDAIRKIMQGLYRALTTKSHINYIVSRINRSSSEASDSLQKREIPHLDFLQDFNRFDNDEFERVYGCDKPSFVESRADRACRSLTLQEVAKACIKYKRPIVTERNIDPFEDEIVKSRHYVEEIINFEQMLESFFKKMDKRLSRCVEVFNTGMIENITKEFVLEAVNKRQIECSTDLADRSKLLDDLMREEKKAFLTKLKDSLDSSDLIKRRYQQFIEKYHRDNPYQEFFEHLQDVFRSTLGSEVQFKYKPRVDSAYSKFMSADLDTVRTRCKKAMGSLLSIQYSELEKKQLKPVKRIKHDTYIKMGAFQCKIQAGKTSYLSRLNKKEKMRAYWASVWNEEIPYGVLMTRFNDIGQSSPKYFLPDQIAELTDQGIQNKTGIWYGDYFITCVNCEEFPFGRIYSLYVQKSLGDNQLMLDPQTGDANWFGGSDRGKYHSIVHFNPWLKQRCPSIPESFSKFKDIVEDHFELVRSQYPVVIQVEKGDDGMDNFVLVESLLHRVFNYNVPIESEDFIGVVSSLSSQIKKQVIQASEQWDFVLEVFIEFLERQIKKKEVAVATDSEEIKVTLEGQVLDDINRFSTQV